MTASVPWICHICHAKFSTEQGCICKNCSSPVCLTHTYVIERSLASDVQRVYQVTTHLQLVGAIRKQAADKLEISFVCAACKANQQPRLRTTDD